MRGLFLTDIHFGRKNNSAQHNTDCVDFIKWMIVQYKTGVLGKIDYIGFLGDWYEHRNAVNIDTLNFSYEGIKLLDDLGLPVYFCVGNHDLYHRHDRSVHSLVYHGELPNIHLIDKPTVIDSLEGKVMFSPYLFPHEYETLGQYSDCQLWAGHFEFEGFILTGSYTKSEHGMDSKKYTKPTILSGHFHKRQQQKNICYVGNVFPMDFSDANDFERGCAVYDHPSNSIEFYNWAECPKYIKTSVSELKKGVVIPPNSRVICEADIAITYEDQMLLKQQLTEKFKVRGVELQDPDIAAIVNASEDSQVELATHMSVDDLITDMLKSISEDGIDSNELVRWYKEA